MILADGFDLNVLFLEEGHIMDELVLVLLLLSGNGGPRFLHFGLQLRGLLFRL